MEDVRMEGEEEMTAVMKSRQKKTESRLKHRQVNKQTDSPLCVSPSDCCHGTSPSPPSASSSSWSTRTATPRVPRGFSQAWEQFRLQQGIVGAVVSSCGLLGLG